VLNRAVVRIRIFRKEGNFKAFEKAIKEAEFRLAWCGRSNATHTRETGRRGRDVAVGGRVASSRCGDTAGFLDEGPVSSHPSAKEEP
jgi:hypothetical protein